MICLYSHLALYVVSQRLHVLYMSAVPTGRAGTQTGALTIGS